MRLEQALDVILARSPAQVLCQRAAGRAVTVLAYHDVVDTDRFAQQLDYVDSHHTVLSLDRFLACLRGDVDWPEAPVLITFDDGDRSVLELGMPELVKRSLPAVVFVITDLIDTDRAPWWLEAQHLLGSGGRSSELPTGNGSSALRVLKGLDDKRRLDALAELRASAARPAPRRAQLRSSELLDLERHGVAIGNHTSSHACLDRCPEHKIRAEIENAHAKLEDRLGHPVAAFAYPNGNLDPRAESVLRELGYEVAFLFDHRQAVRPIDNPLRVSRVRVNSTDHLDRFRIVSSGLHPRLHRLLGRS